MNNTNIRFDEGMGTLLIPLNKEDVGLLDEHVVFRGTVFEPKREVHITVVGKDLGCKLKEAMKSDPLIESQIEQAIEETDWSYESKDKMYHVSKDKKEGDPEEGVEIVHTESIILMMEVAGIQHFYEKLGRITQMGSEVPPTHVTLYTHGDSFGIGLANRADFEECVTGEILPNELKRLSPGHAGYFSHPRKCRAPAGP